MSSSSNVLLKPLYNPDSLKLETLNSFVFFIKSTEAFPMLAYSNFVTYDFIYNYSEILNSILCSYKIN